MNQKNPIRAQPDTGAPAESKPAAAAPDSQPRDASAATPPQDWAELQRKASEHDKLMDRLKRVTADYINSQQRMERRAEERMTYAIEAFARELLLIVDDLSRAIRAAHEHSTPANVSEGLDLVEKHLYAVLARHGITPIETKVGEAFDSNLQEAAAVVQTDELAPNRVMEEMQRGFRLHGRVLRPARVVVSAPKPKTP